MPAVRRDSPCHLPASWDEGLLLSGIADDLSQSVECDRLTRKNWDVASFRALLTHEILSEYDASLFSRSLGALRVPLSDDFRSFERDWLRDEQRHHRGFRWLYAKLYGDSVRKIDAELEHRAAELEVIRDFLQDEFSLLVLLAYDEIVTTKAYVRDFPIYDSFRRPELSKFIRLVARDEAFHFKRIVAMLRSRFAEKLGEVPATLGLVLAADRVDRPYAATFVLDHRGFAPELLAAASCLLLRLCAPERQSAIVASQR